MATATHTRARSSSTLTDPHSLSLKVLRLSRPSLATQTPLPITSFNNGLDIAPNASSSSSSSFPLTPALTLPAAFGAAYVGETFVCTLCVNNELPVPAAEGSGSGRKHVSGVEVVAELQSPTTKQDGNGVALTLNSGDGDDEDSIEPGGTRQLMLHHELKDEGPHVLAVTVSYTETLLLLHTTSDGRREASSSGGRARTFRKLYQFVSQQLVAVRSKVTERNKEREKNGKREWVLEAQLENVGDSGAAIVLEKVWLKESEGIRGKAVNGNEDGGQGIVLKPGDVEQIMFLVTEEEKEEVEADVGGKRQLGQLNIDWRSAMGEKGSLTTGWLSSRERRS